MRKEVPNAARVRHGALASEDSAGMNGAFMFELSSSSSKIKQKFLCVVSDGLGWEHVSVTNQSFKKTPTWDEMCLIKSIFWGDDETVVQYHPAKDDYVNNHPHCLHLWKPVNVELPKPIKAMIGF